jgi:sulfur-carrier protein adenylyltransferase/sulfurtransferase
VAHVIQVGAGSGGMVVLDLVARDPRVTHITIIEPDIYKPHNVARHYFSSECVGDFKAELAEDWLKERRSDLQVRTLICDLLDPAFQGEIEQAVAAADLGVCAVDNEQAKYHWDALMRKYGKPWTLGEVLSGGIGGFIHTFVPDGPCYGCVAGFLQRSVEVEKPATPDYSQPGGAIQETTIPASKAAIHAIAGLHAVLTLQMLDTISSPLSRLGRGVGGEGSKPSNDGNPSPQPSPQRGEGEEREEPNGVGFTTLLLTLQCVPDVFEEAFRPHRFRIPRSADCLICQARPAPATVEDLDVELDRALARLGGLDNSGETKHA